jgi:hypothetical protein
MKIYDEYNYNFKDYIDNNQVCRTYGLREQRSTKTSIITTALDNGINTKTEYHAMQN